MRASDPESRASKGRRPARITWLSAGLLLAGAWQLLGAWQLAGQAGSAAPVLPPDRAVWLVPAAVLYGASGLGLCAAAVGLWGVRRWGWWLGVTLPPVVAGLGWALRLAVERSGYSAATRPVDLATTIAALGLAYCVLLWPSIRKRFGV